MIGRTVSHYQITNHLGQGGMGVVYKALDTRLDRIVALKFLPVHSLPTDDDKARFYREAKAAARLNHANIAHIYEFDETEEGIIYAIQNVELEPVSSLQAEVPEAVGQVVARALEKDPEARYPSAAAMRSALADALGEAKGVPERARRPRRWLRKTKRWAVAVGASVLLVLLG